MNGRVEIFIQQHGRVRLWHKSGPITITDGFGRDLVHLVLAEARIMVPPVNGRYGARGSDLRRQYCEAVAYILNRREAASTGTGDA